MQGRTLSIVLTEHASGILPSLPSFNRRLADKTLTDLIDDCTKRLCYVKQ